MVRTIADNLMSAFYRRTFLLTVLLSLLIALTAPVVMFCLDLFRFTEESAAMASRFIARDLTFDLDDLSKKPDVSELVKPKIEAFLSSANIVELNIWNKEATLLYSFGHKDREGKKFTANRPLAETLRSGTARSTLEGWETPGSLFKGQGKVVVDVFDAVWQKGAIAGAVEVQRQVPDFKFFGLHIIAFILLAVNTPILLYLLLYGKFKKAVKGIVAQEQLILRQFKTLSLNETMEALSHQWRQPLSDLALIVQDMMEVYEMKELDKLYLDDAVAKAMDRIRFLSATMDEFKSFFMPDREKPVFDVPAAVMEMVKLFSAELAYKGIEIKANYDGKERILAAGFPSEFKQVVVNLVANARDAIVARGKSQGKGERFKGFIGITIEEIDRKVAVMIRDNGGGIEPDILPHIFTPYFTTKTSGKEVAGIGLYLSQVIIENHLRGTLEADNVRDGALFTIELDRRYREKEEDLEPPALNF